MRGKFSHEKTQRAQQTERNLIPQPFATFVFFVANPLVGYG
jgi:hypothetical protein